MTGPWQTKVILPGTHPFKCLPVPYTRQRWKASMWEKGGNLAFKIKVWDQGRPTTLVLLKLRPWFRPKRAGTPYAKLSPSEDLLSPYGVMQQAGCANTSRTYMSTVKKQSSLSVYQIKMPTQTEKRSPTLTGQIHLTVVGTSLLRYHSDNHQPAHSSNWREPGGGRTQLLSSCFLHPRKWEADSHPAFRCFLSRSSLLLCFNQQLIGGDTIFRIGVHHPDSKHFTLVLACT